MERTAEAPTWQLVLRGTAALRRLPALSGSLAAEPAELVLGATDAALLALVALDGPQPRARLAAWLWPQATPSAGLGNLRQRLHRLRLRCGGHLVQARGEVLALGPQVRLDSEAEVALAHDSAGILADTGADILGGHDYRHLPQLHAWLEVHRYRRQLTRRAALDEAVARHRAAGDLVAAIGLVQTALAHQPLDESLVRLLMQLHHARGDRVAVQRAVDQCANTMLRELGARPSAETVSLHRQLLQDDRPPGAAAVPGAPGAPLSPAAQALLNLAAVTGQGLSVPLAERALGCTALGLVEPWQALQAAGWFDTDGPVDSPAWQALRHSLPRPILAHLASWVATAGRGAAPAAEGDGHANDAHVTPGGTGPP